MQLERMEKAQKSEEAGRSDRDRLRGLRKELVFFLGAAGRQEKWPLEILTCDLRIDAEEGIGEAVKLDKLIRTCSTPGKGE